MDQEKVIVIDFGGQYNQLVARRVRECNVYCEIYSYKIDIEKIKEMNPKGIILTGGPNSCYEENSPSYQKELFELGIPVLGICYGAQLMMHKLGGKVITPEVGEYGKTEITYSANGVMFKDLPSESVCWMSHFDRIAEAAPGFEVVAHTADCPIAATQNVEKKLYAVQFHPEVLHTKNGTQMIYNFVRGVCGCAGTWKMDSFVKNTIDEIREQVGDGKVLLALSGGVDSSVLAALLAKAIGKQLTCVFVDHGLLRKNEGDEVEGVFGKGGSFDINFVRVNAQERFYAKLKGVEEPERKRKIIGGGMRQVGILAAAGKIALNVMSKRLQEDHDNAKYMAEALCGVKGLEVYKERQQINMVFFRLKDYPLSSAELVDYMAKHDVIINGEDNGIMRFATHKYVTRRYLLYWLWGLWWASKASSKKKD